MESTAHVACRGLDADACWSEPQVSAECADLLRLMLQPDPAERATVADVLRHPWVQRDMSPGLVAVNALLESAPP